MANQISYLPSRNGVSPSMLQAYLSCRQRAKLRIAGWKPIRISEASSFGLMFHNMLGTLYDYYRNHRPPKGTKALIRECGSLAGKFMDAYDQEHMQDSADPNYLNLLERDGSVCLAMLPHYVRFWEKDFREFRWVELESEIDVPFDRFRLKGYRDATYLKKKGSGVWILENKTRSRINEMEIGLMLMQDLQCYMYALATKLQTGKTPAGIDFNVIRRSEMRQRAGESHQEYAQRISGDIACRPDYYFIRYEHAITKTALSEFADHLLIQLSEFENWCLGKIPTYMNQTACVGRYACEFLQMCASGSDTGYRQVSLADRRRKSSNAAAGGKQQRRQGDAVTGQTKKAGAGSK